MLRYLSASTLALLALPAFAAEVPTVAVVGIHQAELDEAAQAAAAAGLAAAIEGTGRFDALLPDEVAAAIRGREKVILEEALLGSARASLTNGRNAYNQASFQDAVAALELAIEAFRRGIAATNTTEELWEAWVVLGTSKLQLDEPDEAGAKDAFRNALALSPSKPLNPALYPPFVVEAFDAVKAESEASVFTLQAFTDGPAKVWVDGVERGQAPATVDGLLPGEHHVVARGEGTQGYTRVVVPPLEAGAEPAPRSEQARLSLKAPSLGEASTSTAGRSGQIDALYNSLGNRAEGVDLVLLAGVDGSLLHLQLLDPDTDLFSKAMEIPFADRADDEAIQTVPLLMNVVGKDGSFTATAATAAPLSVGTNAELALLLTQPRAPAPVVGGGGGGNDDGKKSKTPLVLGIVGGVVAAAAGGTGIWFATRNEEPANQGSIIVQF